MDNLAKLKSILVSRMNSITEEINKIKVAREIISLKVKISHKLLNNDYHKIVLCNDEEIKKLIDNNIIQITFEDYKSIKVIIENEEIFIGAPVEIPQYVSAIKQANNMLHQINDNIDSNIEYINGVGSRIDTLERMYQKCSEINDCIGENELITPIMDIDFVISLLNNSVSSIIDRTNIVTILVSLNNKAFDKERSKKEKVVAEKQEDNSNISFPELLEHTLRSRLSSQNSQSNPVSEVQPEINIEEDDQIEDETEYITKEEAEELYNTARSIISTNNYPSLIYYNQPLEELLNNLNAIDELLKSEPNNEELLKERQEILRMLDNMIEEYLTQQSYFIKEESKGMDSALLRPGEQYRLIYLMHPENNKQAKNLTKEEFFKEGLESFFEEDAISTNNVDNYRRISKVLNELRHGTLINVGRNEHKFNDELKEYAVKKNFKVRVGYRQINEDTILIIGYSEQLGKAKNSNTSYTRAWKDRETLYGGKIEDIIKGITDDPEFRDFVYRYSREVDDRIIDVLEMKKIEGLSK